MPWAILGCATMLGFAMWAPMFCVPPMEHILKEELMLTHAQTSLLYSAPMIMMIAVSIPAGIISDRIGLRKAAGIGAILIAVGALLRGTAGDATSLLAYTFIYGAGFAWSFPNLLKLVSARVPQEKAGIAIGIFTSGFAAGIAVAMATTIPLVFPITSTFQGVFLFWSIPAIAAAILWWIVVREPTPNNTHGEPANTKHIPFRRIIQNRHLWTVIILFLLTEFFFYTWAGWSPALLMLKGATAESAGLLTSITMWVAVAGCLLMPHFSKKVGLRKPFIWGPALILVLAAWLIRDLPLSMVWLPMVLVGIADLTRYITLLAVLVELMSEKELGRASGLLLSIGSVGGFIGPYIGGYILDVTGSLELLLFILIGASIATAVITLRLPETGPRAKIKEQ